MRLCFGSYATVLKICANEAVTNRILVSKLVGLVDKNHALDENDLDWLYTRLLNCISGFPKAQRSKNREVGTSRTSIMSLISKIRTEDIVAEFEEEILPLLVEDKKRDAILYLKSILAEDEDAVNRHNMTFRKYMGVEASQAATAHRVKPALFLSGLFLYSVAVGENKSTEGKQTVEEIKKDGYLDKVPPFLDDFELDGIESFPEKEEEHNAILMSEPLSHYFYGLKDRFSKVKTLLDNDAPRPIYSFYVPNSFYFFRKLQVQIEHVRGRNLAPAPSGPDEAFGFFRERGHRNRQVA